MTTKKHDVEYSLFNASDDWILHYIDDAVFDKSLLFNILFQERILMHESYFFNSSLLARHIKRSKTELSLFEYAAQRGLIVPTVRNKSETLREAYDFLHSGKLYNSFNLLIPELKPYKNRIIGAVDYGLNKEKIKPKWWPEPTTPDKVLGNQYLKLGLDNFREDFLSVE